MVRSIMSGLTTTIGAVWLAAPMRPSSTSIAAMPHEHQQPSERKRYSLP